MKKSLFTRSALVALAVSAPLASHAAISTLPVTGWNQDMFINPGLSSYNQSITGTIDNGPGNIEGSTFAASGTYSVQGGGATDSVVGFTGDVYTSATGSGATFEFQDFNANNSLLLTGGTSGTLTLTVPTSMTTLALFGTSGNGPTSGSVTFTFSDSTTSTYTITSGITSDWFSGATPALAIGHRESNHSEDGYTSIYYESNPVISIFETDIALTGADLGKTVTSLTIANTGNNGDIAVMAVSSDGVVPEASTAALLGACGVLALARRRRA